VTPVVERLPNKHKTLSSNPNTAPQKKKTLLVNEPQNPCDPIMCPGRHGGFGLDCEIFDSFGQEQWGDRR
jgi:hypothetical protein